MAEDTRSTCPEFNSAYIGKDRILSAYASATGKSPRDRKSTRLNSSHGYISYAVFCLKKKKNDHAPTCTSARTASPAPLPPTAPTRTSAADAPARSARDVLPPAPRRASSHSAAAVLLV